MKPTLIELDAENAVRADCVHGIHLGRCSVTVTGPGIKGPSYTIAKYKTTKAARENYKRIVAIVSSYLAGPQSADAPTEPVPAAPEPAQV